MSLLYGRLFRIFRYRRIASVSAVFFTINTILNIWLTFLEIPDPAFDLGNSKDVKLSWLRRKTRVRHAKTERDYPHGYQLTPTDDYLRKFDHSLLIIYLRCHYAEFAERALVRRTWGRDMIDRFKVAFIFALGTPRETNRTTIQSLHSENEAYGDLLMGGYVEDYGNLTLKMWSILDWSDERFSKLRVHPKVIFWGNVDTVILPHKMLEFAAKLAPTKNIISGYILQGVKPVRDKSNKWHVPLSVYKYPQYPDFIWGSGVFATWDAADHLLVAVESAPTQVISSFTPDDVLMTGIWREKMNIKLFQCNYCRAYEDFKLVNCDDWKTTIFAHGNHFDMYMQLRKDCGDWSANDPPEDDEFEGEDEELTDVHNSLDGNVDATNIDETNFDATNVDATNIDDTNVDDTNFDATNFDGTNVNDEAEPEDVNYIEPETETVDLDIEYQYTGPQKDIVDQLLGEYSLNNGDYTEDDG